MRTPSATSCHVFTAEGPLGELSVQVEGEVETRDTQGIVRGAVERFPPSLYLRETPLTAADDAIAEFAAKRPREAAGDDVLGAPARDPRSPVRTDDLRSRTRPTSRRRPRRHSRSSAASARTSPTSSSPRRAVSAFRPAMSAAISPAATASSSRRPAMPGRRPTSPNSAGSRSTPPTGCARPTPMSGSPSGSTISAPRRCAAPAMVAAARLLTVRLQVQQAMQQTQE